MTLYHIDLGGRFKMFLGLRNSASMQPRKHAPKIGDRLPPYMLLYSPLIPPSPSHQSNKRRWERVDVLVVPALGPDPALPQDVRDEVLVLRGAEETQVA